MKSLILGLLLTTSGFVLAGDTTCTDSHGTELLVSISSALENPEECEEIDFIGHICPATLTVGGEYEIKGMGFEGEDSLSFVALSGITELIWDSETKEGSISMNERHIDDITCQ